MKLGIIGAGSWGSALTMILAEKAETLTLFGRDQALIEAINASGFHPNFKKFQKPKNVTATCDTADLNNCDILLSVIPAQNTRAFLKENPLPALPFILCSKGIEQSTGQFLSDMVAEVAPHLTPAILSGPSFADDAMRGLPTAVTIAAKVEGTAKILAQSLMTKSFRLYHTTDMRGVEIGGAAKNVLSIAAGIVEGLGLGASAKAAIITRGFAELTRFGEAYGAHPKTLSGLSGLGDLILSANSPQSRNFSYGFALGNNATIPTKLAEGVYTAEVIVRLARAKSVDMPICEAVHAILNEGLSLKEAMTYLLGRPQRGE